MNNNYTVYIHKFPNGKYYIGLTKMNPQSRWGRDGSGYKTQFVYKAIQKYGWDNIEHIIYKDNLTAEEASRLEEELIEQYNSVINGYNVTLGGDMATGVPKIHNYKGKGYSIYQLLDNPDINTHNITYSCAKYRLSKGWGIEEVFDIPQEDIHNHYEYDGKQYTIYDLIELNGMGLTYDGVVNRLRRGWSIEDIIKTPLNTKTMLREYLGNLYSLSELAEKFGDKSINGTILGNRLRNGWDIERALKQPVGTKKQPFGITEPTYEYNGKLYNSYQLSQIHPELGLTSANIISRINNHHWDIERAISTPKKIKIYCLNIIMKN